MTAPAPAVATLEGISNEPGPAGLSVTAAESLAVATFSTRNVTVGEAPDSFHIPSRNALDEWRAIVEAKRAAYRSSVVFRARHDASVCIRCDTPIGPQDTVYRLWTYREHRRVFGPQCGDCATPRTREAATAPCEGCGRSVVSVDRYRWSPRRHVACSEVCEARAYRLARKPEREPIDCQVCGERMDVRRGDARYCSDACRQKAYRARRAA